MPLTHLLIHCPGISQLSIGDLGEGDMSVAVELGAFEQKIVGDFVNMVRANARIATIARPEPDLVERHALLANLPEALGAADVIKLRHGHGWEPTGCLTKKWTC